MVAATPQRSARIAWTQAACRWAAGRRQLIEGLIRRSKNHFGLEPHGAKTPEGLLTRLAAKVAAYTCGQPLNAGLGRPLRYSADLLI